VPQVRADVVVRLIAGGMDADNALYSTQYAEALRKRGVDADISVVPDLGHNILLTQPVLEALARLLGMDEQPTPGAPVAPTQSAPAASR